MSKLAASRAERAETRRRRVLDAARHCFARVGFHSTSMASIAHQAGMSVGQIYRDFPSKEALIEAIVQQDLDDQADAMQALVDAHAGQSLSVLAAGARSHALGAASNAERMALMLEVAAEAARNPRVRAIVGQVERRGRIALDGAFGPAKPDGWSDAEFMARLELLSTLLTGFAVRMSHGASPSPELLELLDRTALAIIAPDGP